MGGRSATQDARLGRVVEAIPSWRSASRVTFSPLEGGITNHNYLVEVDGDRFVVRLAGKDTEFLGIDREAERAAAVAAHEVGIGPDVIEFLPELGCLVTRFIEAEHIPPERMSEAGMLKLVARVLRAFHGGPVLPSTFSPFRVVEVYQEEAA